MKHLLHKIKHLGAPLTLITLLLLPGLGWGQTADVTARPTHIDLSSATSESAVLMTLSGYTSNDAKYRLYNGSNQYNPWDEATDSYITSTSYASGPQVPGNPTTSTTFWIVFQRGNNNATAATYRDRLGTAYSSNYQTVALPDATSITSPFSLTGTFTGSGGYDNSVKHVVLGFNGATIVTAASTSLSTGAFTLVCPGVTTIDKIEVRAIDNTSIANITGSWTTTTNVGNIPAGSTPTITVAPTTLDNFTYIFGSGLSTSQSYNLSASNLTPASGNITITPSSNYEVSLDNSIFSQTAITKSYTSGTLASTPVYVRLKLGLSVGNYNSEVIANSGGDATTVNVTCSGSVTAPPPPDAPVATAATNVANTSFTANWEAVSGATGYRLDVYTKTAGGNATDLFISEYIEGSSNNKAIEIYNGTGASINLTGYNLKIYTNGSTTPGSAINLTDVSLANGETYVVANSSANATILALADQTSGSLTHNGNDAIGLFNGTTLIDVVGPIGDDTDWGKDVTLARKSDAAVPSTTYSAADWDSYSVDETAYLGSHTFAGGLTNTYVAGFENKDVGNGTSYSVTELNPSTTYYYVVRAVGAGGGTSANSNEISAITTNTTPTITVSTATLSGFSYPDGNGPSSEQSFTVEGNNLENNISITATTNYEISTGSGGSFSATSPITLTRTDGVVGTTTIYVRLKAGLSPEDFNNEVINITSSPADAKTVTCSGSVIAQINWCNLQWPLSGSSPLGDSYIIYAQVYEPGVTDAAGQGTGIQAWIGYSTTDTDPSTWTDWVVATYLGDVGNNDEYIADIGAAILSTGDYYTASRFQLGTAPFVYGGTTGLWSTGKSGTLTITAANQIDWANLQFPATGSITSGDVFDVFAQIYEPGVTPGAGQGAGITAWIGYSTTDTDPSTWTNWVEATYNTDAGDNDEYMANIAGNLIPGTYYYASRFKKGLADYVYGGYNGGFWNGTSNVSGVLTVGNPPVPNAWINEIHYDNDGTDANEFIEVVVENAGNYTLGNFKVELYNFTGGAVYDTKDLSLFTVGNTEGNFTFYTYNYTANTLSIQNGPQDGMALSYGNVVIPGQFLSYEGTLIATDGYANGLTSTDIGVSETTSTTGDQSLQLAGVGTQYSAFIWQSPATNTLGALNNFQSFGSTTAWNGSVNNDWHTSTNWTPGIPSATTDVTIPFTGITNFPTLNAAGTCKDILIESGATILDNGNLTVTGTATAERAIAGAEQWHFLSSPVAAQTISGDWTPSGSYGDGTGYDFYAWEESNVEYPWLNQKVPANGITNFIPGKGYLVAYQVPDTKEFTGALNTGDITFNLKKSGSKSWTYTSGWNLIGNPYPSAIDWNLATRTLFQDEFAYIYDGTGYTTVDGSLSNANIAANQGFFVLSDVDNQNFIFTDATRVHGGSYLKNTIVDDKFVIQLANENYSDNTTIRYREQGSAQRDRLDALKLFSFSELVPQVYTRTSDEINVAVNSIPGNDEVLSIPLLMKVPADGNLSISLTDVEGAFTGKTIFLHDHVTGEAINLSSNPVYNFFASQGEEVSRFTLHFSTLGMDDPSTAAPVNIYAYSGVVYLNGLDATASVTITDLTGRVVMAERVNGNGLSMINAGNLPKGVYVVTAVSGSRVVSAKVIL